MSSLWLLAATMVVVMCAALVALLRRVEAAAAALRREADHLDLARRELTQGIEHLREARAGHHRRSEAPGHR